MGDCELAPKLAAVLSDFADQIIEMRDCGSDNTESKIYRSAAALIERQHSELTRLRSENERLREALGATRAEVAEILKNIIECRAANFVGVAHPRFDEESQKEIARLEALLRKADGALQQGEKLEETSNG